MLQPDNKEAARELRLLKGAFDKQRKKEAKKFAGMFDRIQVEEAAEAAAAAAAPSAAPSSGATAPGGGGGVQVDVSYGEAASTVASAGAGEPQTADVGERLGDVQSFEPKGACASIGASARTRGCACFGADVGVCMRACQPCACIHVGQVHACSSGACAQSLHAGQSP